MSNFAENKIYMKRYFILFAALCLIASAAVGKTRKTLFVIIDGIPADCVERLQPPTIMDIAHAGAYHRAFCGGEVSTYNETPTVSAIGYTSVLTGTWMNKHNVRGNGGIKANYNYPTIFRVAKDQKRDVKTGIFSSWTDNRTILLGEGLKETGCLRVDCSRDGYDLDTLRFPKKPGDLHIQDIDRQVADDAAQCIAHDAPDVNWLYLWYPDDAFHNHGNGKISDEALMEADRMLGKVWREVKRREKQNGEEWLVIVTTDHGRENSGYNHGGQSERERTIWMAVNRRDLNGEFYSRNLSHVDIMPTICRYMGFALPQKTEFEIDGTPFCGPSDIYNMQALKYDADVLLTWEAREPGNADADIYYADTNNISLGGEDAWHKIATVKAADCRYMVKLGQLPESKFYKFAVRTKAGTLNKWFLVK